MGYRGSKSRRNRFTKAEATTVVNQIRTLVKEQLAETEVDASDVHELRM